MEVRRDGNRIIIRIRADDAAAKKMAEDCANKKVVTYEGKEYDDCQLTGHFDKDDVELILRYVEL